MVKGFKKMKIGHAGKINKLMKKSSNTEKNKASKEQIEVFDYANEKNENENRMNTKDEILSESIKKNEEINQRFNIYLSKKIKKKIRDTNLRNAFSFALEEYTKSTFANKIFDIFSLRKIKLTHHSL